jgi:pimeloyl-ACP methyl ester carboxylesterase
MNAEFIRLITEDKLGLQGIIYRPSEKTDKAFLHIHGMAGNFYENRFLDAMAEELTGSGYAFITINTRGHDFIADLPIIGSEEKSKRIGDVYEKFEECLLDIKPAINYLEEQGYKEIVLCGHSLGAVKVAYYIAETQDSRVQKLVLMSPPDMVGLAEAEDYHQEMVGKSNKLIAEGKGEEILPKKLWDWYYLSANTYINLCSRDYPVDVFITYNKEKPSSTLGKIRIPTLAFLGEKDDAVIMPPKDALEIIKKKSKNVPSFETDIIARASHGYFGEESAMAQRITIWLNR